MDILIFNKKTMKKTILFLLIGFRVLAQQTNPYNANTVFEQMGTALPTPNTYRTASGAPGKEYWQQKADYDIKVELDDETQKIKGSEKITYSNFSFDPLTYLWLQLDQNHFSQNSDAKTTRQTSISHDRGSTGAALKSLDNSTEKDFGHKIEKVTD